MSATAPTLGNGGGYEGNGKQTGAETSLPEAQRGYRANGNHPLTAHPDLVQKHLAHRKRLRLANV